MTNFTVTTQKS